MKENSFALMCVDHSGIPLNEATAIFELIWDLVTNPLDINPSFSRDDTDRLRNALSGSKLGELEKIDLDLKIIYNGEYFDFYIYKIKGGYQVEEKRGDITQLVLDIAPEDT